MPLDSEAAAINVLETTAYFQGKWTVNDYLNQFFAAVPQAWREVHWFSSLAVSTCGDGGC